jgi:hypothetical protein
VGTWDELWGEWQIIGNSKGFSSLQLTLPTVCYAKVGDEIRSTARKRGDPWDDLVSVDGGRLKSDLVIFGSELYGVGMEGQLVRRSSSRVGWQDLGTPFGEILGTPAVTPSTRINDVYVVVKGSDNRLYLRYTDDHGKTWDEWEQGDKLRAGQFTGNPSTFTIPRQDRSHQLVLAGQSLEGEMASISREGVSLGEGSDPDKLWGEWSVVENSSGYSSPVFVRDPVMGPLPVFHCFVKVGDEVRHARYRDGRWDSFASVNGGRFRSDPVVVVDRQDDTVEVYGVGLEGQLARNIWSARAGVWEGWENLGRPEAGIAGTPSVERFHGDRFVVAKGGDNRVYLRWLDRGIKWGPWEQGDKLRPGQIRGDVSTAVTWNHDTTRELLVAGRSLEGEIATISLPLPL